jgi:hypothetical protein
MSVDTPKAGLEPLRRLLESARDGSGEAKVDALIALSQRTLFIATWEPETTGFRTLENSKGETALPVFTGVDVYPAARARFGWPDRTVVREIGARQAFRFVVDNSLGFLVVDVGTEHAFEASPNELRPLVAPPSRHSASGPFASVGKTSSQLLQAVRGSDRPPPREPSRDSAPSVPPPRLESLRVPSPASRPPPAPPPSRPPPAPPTGSDEVVLEALDAPPDDALLEALADALSGFLEVEWAAYCRAARGPFPAQHSVALRLDPYRDRLPEIIDSLRSSAMREGIALDVILADTPHLVRLVRERGVLFHPWLDKGRR